MSKDTITVDGCTYTVELSHDGDVIHVLDCEGQRVASAEHDHADEALHASFFDVDGHIEGHDSRQADLFGKSWQEVASWLVSVHPCN
jgi:hypothetical protein